MVCRYRKDASPTFSVERGGLCVGVYMCVHGEVRRQGGGRIPGLSMSRVGVVSFQEENKHRKGVSHDAQVVHRLVGIPGGG